MVASTVDTKLESVAFVIMVSGYLRVEGNDAADGCQQRCISIIYRQLSRTDRQGS